ncbi:MAG TPA: MurR/RpiR family transcriptional regulator [Anaerolineaceae bacterium]|nr:MurR/RpiR family transcriptional regulator [Anaerolineaceae bacterium]
MINYHADVDFNQVLTSHYGALTKSEKRIADFIRKNQDESSLLSAAEVAERLNLSEATIVRFARALDYPSYPALREKLQENFRQRITHSSRLRSRLDDLRDNGDIFERLTAVEIDYLTQALESVDRSSMQQAVGLLKKHQRIFVFGLGPSCSLVELLQLRLSRFGKHVIPLTNSGREVVEPLVTMQPSDLVIVICFFDANPALRLVLEHSQKVGCPVIMITDTLAGVVGQYATVILSAQRGPVGEFHSLVVPMTIINALLLTVASEQQESIMPILDDLDSLREQLRVLNNQG